MFCVEHRLLYLSTINNFVHCFPFVSVQKMKILTKYVQLQYIAKPENKNTSQSFYAYIL